MTFLIGLTATLIVLGIMIVIHELGHHLVAKAFGVRVEIFSVGFGKRLFGKVWRGTDYRLSALPFGGYVKMAGMDAVESKVEMRTDDPGEFLNHPRWQRVLIAAAGPVMNILLAVALLTGLFMVRYTHLAYVEKPVVLASVDADSPAAKSGFRAGDRVVRIEDTQNPTWEQLAISMVLYSEHPIDVAVMRGNEMFRLKLSVDMKYAERYQGMQPKDTIIQVAPGLPAQRAGMEDGDEIIALDGQKISSIQGMIEYFRTSKEKSVNITVLRNGAEKVFAITPVLQGEGAESRYRIGVGPMIHVDSLPFGQALQRSVIQNEKNSALIFTLLQKLLERRVSLNKVDGPVGIGRAITEAVQRPTWEDRIVDTLFLMSLISLNLGIFNLLPIPILDGGLILLTTIEGIMRREINQRLKERIYQTAFVALLIFAVVVIFNDVTKWIGS